MKFGMCCQKVTFLLDHNRYNPIVYYQGYMYSAEESESFINKEGTVEKKMSSRLNTLIDILKTMF